MHARVAHLLWLDRRSHADHPWAALVPWLLSGKCVAAQAAALCTQQDFEHECRNGTPILNADMQYDRGSAFLSCCDWLLNAEQASYWKPCVCHTTQSGLHKPLNMQKMRHQ